jgi:hypothetical protein
MDVYLSLRDGGTMSERLDTAHEGAKAAYFGLSALRETEAWLRQRRANVTFWEDGKTTVGFPATYCESTFTSDSLEEAVKEAQAYLDLHPTHVRSGSVSASPPPDPPTP